MADQENIERGDASCSAVSSATSTGAGQSNPEPAPTPRTDAACATLYGGSIVDAGFARQLERELSEARKQIEMDTECIERIREHGMRLEVERDREAAKPENVSCDPANYCPEDAAEEEISNLKKQIADLQHELTLNNEAAMAWEHGVLHAQIADRNSRIIDQLEFISKLERQLKERDEELRVAREGK